MPKEKITKDEIVDVAFQIVRNDGYKALSARAIARELELSTMPIYSQIGNMRQLDKMLAKKIDAELVAFQKEHYTDNTLLNMSIGYVLFAQEEKHLFNFITQDRPAIMGNGTHGDYFAGGIVDDLNEMHADGSDKKIVAESFPGMANRDVGNIARNGWIFTHGLATLLHSGLLPPMSITEMEKTVTEAGTAFYLLQNMNNTGDGDDLPV